MLPAELTPARWSGFIMLLTRVIVLRKEFVACSVHSASNIHSRFYNTINV